MVPGEARGTLTLNFMRECFTTETKTSQWAEPSPRHVPLLQSAAPLCSGIVRRPIAHEFEYSTRLRHLSVEKSGKFVTILFNNLLATSGLCPR